MHQDTDFIKKKNVADIIKNFDKKSNDTLVKEFNDYNIIKKKKTVLQEFYTNQCIFITGGTGFLGKILIEKLLRCCPDILRIYVLVRSKKDKNVTIRLNELFSNPVFDRLRKNMPNFSNKVVGISGDCSLPNLGLSIHDTKLLIDEVTIVFHVAAALRFNEELGVATTINVQSLHSINEICQNMKKLKSFVHVSTAYSNCFSPCIEEKFYDYSIKSEEFLDLVKSLSKDVMDEMSPKLMSSWPNTYTFTKALGEDLIRTKGKNLPIGIFRPGIVISSAEEPIPGWIDNYNGPSGLAVAVANGLMRALFCNLTKVANIVPVDLTVNALIASAWDIAIHVDRRNEEMLIYNFTSTTDAPITWQAFIKLVLEHINKYPMNNAVWYAVTKSSKYKFIHWLNTLILHWIPASVIDFILVSIGKKPRFIKMYQKLHKYMDVLAHFSVNEWMFINDNVKGLWQQLDFEDKQMFPFSMVNFDWQNYFDNYIKGIRIYLIKDDLKTLEASKIKWKRLYWLHQLLYLLLYILGFWLLWTILPRMFK